MLGARRRFWVLGGLLVLINIAGIVWIRQGLTGRGAARFRVLSLLPGGDVESADRLALLFDTPVVEPEAIGRALERSPFAIQPAVAGHWQWSAVNRLELVLDRKLPPGRAYKIQPVQNFELALGGTLVGKTDFDVRTRPLALTKCQVLHVEPANVDIEFTFNQPVAPHELIDHLYLRGQAKGNRMTGQALGREPADTILVRTGRPDGSAVFVKIDSELKGHNGQLPLGSTYESTLPVKPRFVLSNVNVNEPGADPMISAELRFSAPLDRDQATPVVAITPAVKDVQVVRDNYALRLTGAFQCGQRYKFEVAETVRSADGQTLGTPAVVYAEIPDRRSTVRFPFSDGILSPAGSLSLDAELVNVSGVKLTGSRVHANNLVAHLNDADEAMTSRDLPEKTFTLNVPRNAPTKATLDLVGVLGRSARGVYHLALESTSDRWVSAEAMVAITDLGLTAKQHRDGYLVWVTSLRSARPVEGAKVSAITRNNQVVATAITDGEGLTTLRVPAKHPDGAVWVIVAELGDDLAYLLPARRPWVVEDVEQGGRAIPRSYDAMLYTDRGVYRPGETVHLTGILRDGSGQIPPAFPMTLSVRRPDGRPAGQLPVTTAPAGQGVFHADFATPADGQEGEYQFAVGLPGSDEPFGQAATFVESFVPVRMEVKATAAAKLFASSQPVAVTASARYLFGPAAAELPVRARLTLRPAVFTSARFAEYDFTGPKVVKRPRAVEAEDSLDEDGAAELELEPDTGGVKGFWAGAIAVTVTEPGGRSVSTNLSVNVDTAGRYVGLLPPASRIVPTGQPVDVPWVRVTADDQPAPGGELSYSLARIEYDWTVEQGDESRDRVWKTVERAVTVNSGRLTGAEADAGRGTISVRCPEPGNYRLIVTDTQSGSQTLMDLCAAWPGQDVSGFAVNRPERLEIVLDRAKYVPGTSAHVLVRSPFKTGTMLLTVETDGVLDQRVIELTGTSAELDIPVLATLRGGAFVSASAVRPVDPDSDKWMPHRAVGLARLAIDANSHRMAVAIDAPRKAEPGKKVRIRVQATTALEDQRPGVVHLWAVDQGILLTTRFATPDPMAHFFAPRRLGVVSSDVFLDLLPDYRRPKTMLRIGGDAAAHTIRRLGPVPIKRRASAVVWAASVPLAADGSAQAEWTLPDLTGELRVMAVAVDHDRYGSAHAAMTLAWPVMVEATWPRFAAPGDVFAVPVKLFNTADRAVDAAVRMEVVGPVRVRVGPVPTTAPNDKPETPTGETTTLATCEIPPVRVDAGASRIVWVNATALECGQVSVRTVATAGDRDARDLAEFTVRPAGPLHTVGRLLRAPASQPSTIELDDPTFLPGTTRTRITLGGQPSVQLRPAMEELIGYPYGCAEQTTSRLYALLFARQILTPDDARIELTGEMVRSGLSRLWSMQTPDGGVSYWPGGDTSCLWATVYVADFLPRAKRAGFEPAGPFVTELCKYLNRSLRRSENGESLDDNTRAVMLHSLAAFGQPQTAWMNKLQDRPDGLNLGGRAHLAAAWLATGRKDLARAILPADALTMSSPAAANRLTSDVAGEAAMLDVLLDLDPGHAWTARLADRLNAARTRSGGWASTIDNAQCLAALARYQLAHPQPGEFAGQASAGGVVRQFSSTQPAAFTVTRPGPLTLDCAGTGQVFISAITEGFARDPKLAAYDRQLQVRRTWTDRDGKPIDLARLKVGDLVRVEVTLQRIGAGPDVDDVAVVDALPGGLEVENPALSTADRSGEATSAAPGHVEFRDDRVLLFASAKEARQTYRYALRATTAGVFALPPIQASGMYDPSFASVHGAATVRVAP